LQVGEARLVWNLPVGEGRKSMRAVQRQSSKRGRGIRAPQGMFRVVAGVGTLLAMAWTSRMALSQGAGGPRQDEETAAWESEGGDSNGNPPAPRQTDPTLKRVRGVPLPGREGGREGAAGTPLGVRPGRSVLSSPSPVEAGEPGFGVVRKPGLTEHVTTAFPPRIVFLNGANVSSLRGETLENVRVKIDEDGNIHITAPHYDVTTDTSFHPLLPTELPRLPKAKREPLDLPQGRYSKESVPAMPRQRNPAGPSPVPAPSGKVTPSERGSLPRSAPQPKVEVLPEAGDSFPPASLDGAMHSDSPDGQARPLRISDDAQEERTAQEGKSGMKGVEPRWALHEKSCLVHQPRLRPQAAL
jgi:hypothetical protein